MKPTPSADRSPPPSSLSRRDFVKRSGAGVAAGAAAASPLLAALPAVLAPGALGQDKEVRLAWIGVGGRGSSLLGRAMDNVSTANLRVTAICDIDPRARQRGIERCASMRPVGVEDYREVLKMKEVDAVFIATPIHLHAEMAVAAAQAGKHCYCEKPLAPTAEGVKAIYDAVKKAGIKFQVGFQWRYSKIYQEVIGKVHAGEIGKVHFVTAHRHIGGYPDSGWYVDRKLSGDLIVEQAVHEMNVFCWLLGGPPLRAAGFGGINALAGKPPDRTIMDHYAVSYEFPEGVHLNYTHCVYAASGMDRLDQIVHGERTAADLVSGAIHKGGQVTPGSFPSLPDPTGEAIASFVDCVRNDKEPLSNVDAGRNATLMAILGRTAIHDKRVAEWKDVAL